MEALWDKIAFWKKPKTFEPGVDYEFHDFEDSDLTGVRIIQGPYAGVLYYYTGASVAEEGLGAVFKFGYQVVEAGNYTRKDLDSDEKFVTMMGDILTTIILMDGQFESPRTFYSEKSSI
jgi:hypothetical protein